MVNAWASRAGLVLGQQKTEAKSNEITAIPALLEVLELSGCIVSIDAMGCQTAIANTIREKDADYLLAVKGNQETLYEDIQLYLDTLSKKPQRPQTASFHETIEKGHGRVEVRRCWSSTEIDWLDQRDRWRDLAMIGVVESERHQGDQVSLERRYFISSLNVDAKTSLAGVRSHWAVENNLHWVLDIAFREDECRIRKGFGAENMAVFRQIALNLIKQEKTVKLGVKNRRMLAAADDDYRMKVLNTII
jgi:predicted transposase YbfD/YdcC